MLARGHWILWTLFIGLQIADFVTTNYALAVPANREANPIMQFQNCLGAALWLLKVATAGFAALVARQTLRPWPLLIAASYYIFVVSGNLVSLSLLSRD
jgi:hypothetical protein